MKPLHVAAVVMIVIGTRAAASAGQTVIVPETPFTPEPGFSVTNESTALIDADSVFIASDNGAIHLDLVNINTGSIESPHTFLPVHAVSPSVAALGADRVFISARLRGPGPNDDETGAFFVVNPLTGAIVHGPVPFSAFGTDTTFHVAVADANTVVMAYSSEGGAGRFTVVDPVNGTIKLAETTFEPEPIGSMDTAALDPHRVLVVYSINGESLIRVVIIDPQSGAVLSGPRDLPQLGAVATVESVLRLDGTDVLLAYVGIVHDGDSLAKVNAFVTLNTATGTTSAPTIYASGARFGSPALLGTKAVFLPITTFVGPARFAVHGRDGSIVVPQTMLNPEITQFISSTASGCRVLVAYDDDDGVGKFQVLDFSDVCTPPPPCPSVTDQVNVFRSPLVPFFSPYFQLQFVAIHNPTTEAIAGPIAFTVDDLQNGILFASTTTTCGSVAPVQFAVFHPGADEILSPGEVAGGFLLFLQISAAPISYTPRPLAGIPPH